MATSTPASTRYQDPFFQSGFSEVLTQQADVFNERSRGALQLQTNRKHGDFDYSAFFQNSTLVSRLDPEAAGSATAVALSQDTDIGVKLTRMIGPVEWSRQAFLKAGLDMDAFRVAAGRQSAVESLIEMLDAGVLGTVSALRGQAAAVHDDGAVTLDTTQLVNGLALFGDRADRIIAWVMHSKSAFDLLKFQVDPANNGDVIANRAVISGSPATLNRPIIVSDSDALFEDGGTSGRDHFVLGLTEGGLVIEDTEEEYATVEEITGQAKGIVLRLQGEYAYNLHVKGFKWDVANGGKNPADAAVGTSTNWDPTRQSVKDFAGGVIVVGDAV